MDFMQKIFPFTPLPRPAGGFQKGTYGIYFLISPYR